MKRNRLSRLAVSEFVVFCCCLPLGMSEQWVVALYFSKTKTDKPNVRKVNFSLSADTLQSEFNDLTSHFVFKRLLK